MECLDVYYFLFLKYSKKYTMLKQKQNRAKRDEYLGKLEI